MPKHSFQRWIDTFQQPSSPAISESYWPYPLPEAEMIARYGLRCLTPDERLLFPGLRLVLQISKVQLTKPPAVMPMAQAGWVVWIAETYRGHYLVRFPGGATLFAPFNEMLWMAPSAGSGQAVADDVPALNLVDAKITERGRHWRTAVLRDIHQNLQI